MTMEEELMRSQARGSPEARNSEFGHVGIISKDGGWCIDAWGVGPFIIADEKGRCHRFEDSDRWGPYLISKRGDLLKNQPGERALFWRAHRIWVKQGRRLADDGMTCIWDEPKPNIIRHIGGRHWELVEAGDDEDGKYIKIATPKAEPREAGTQSPGQRG